MSGITKNLIGAKNDVIFHVSSEYDYRYCAELRRQEYIDAAKAAFAEKKKENLPIYGVPKECLKNFVTCQKLARRGVSKIPPKQFIMVEENLLQGVTSKQSVYEKDEQEALKKAMDYKGEVMESRSTNFTDKEGEDSQYSKE